MTRATFEVICEQLGTFDTFKVTPCGRKAVPLDKQLLVFLWHVGGLEPLCRTADRFNVTELTVLRIRTKMCKVVKQHFIKKYITWPKDQDKQAIIRAFRDKRGFPDVIGALDSTHIQIRPPKEHLQTYVNRKGYHSIILQAVCREDMRFKNCFVGWPGSCHDSRVLKNSDLWDNGQRWCGEKHLIGDGGFPLTSWLLTPFRDTGHLTPVQRHYNFCLSSTRQVIERSFSLLKGRFRKLQNLDVQSVVTAVEICITRCVFHSICILQDDELGEFFHEIDHVNPPAPAIVVNDAAGIAKRNAVAQQLI